MIYKDNIINQIILNIMSLFRSGKTICYVQRNKGESIDVFLERGNFVISQMLHETYKKSIIKVIGQKFKYIFWSLG